MASIIDYMTVVETTVISNDATLFDIINAFKSDYLAAECIKSYVGGRGTLLVPQVHPRQGGYGARYSILEEAGLARKMTVGYYMHPAAHIPADILRLTRVYREAQLTGDWEPFFRALTAHPAVVGWRSRGEPATEKWILAIAMHKNLMKIIVGEA